VTAKGCAQVCAADGETVPVGHEAVRTGIAFGRNSDDDARV